MSARDQPKLLNAVTGDDFGCGAAEVTGHHSRPQEIALA
jgi:hypothetical protein